MKTNLTMKTITKSLIVAGVVGALSLPAAANKYRDYDNSTFDYAKVVGVTPVVESYQVNNPVEKCWNERVPVRHKSYNHNDGYKSHTPTILGAIIGGVVGNQVGKRGGGRARDVATVAGAVLGGSVGRDVNNKQRRHRDSQYRTTSYESVQRCELKDSYTTKKEVVGYDVAYRYKGNVFHTQMNQHPGDKIKVKVTVNPV